MATDPTRETSATWVIPVVPEPRDARIGRATGGERPRVAYLDNSKGNARLLLGRIAEAVAAGATVGSVAHYRKGNPSLPAPGELLDRIAREADWVVTASAD